MRFSIANHWLNPAQREYSPNCDQRPAGATLDLIVIHNISLPPKQYGNDYVRQFFCNQLDYDLHPYFSHIKNLKVSAHLLIQRDGGVIQFVPFNERAWHAGESNFQGRSACNDFSIGIELEGSDDDPYTEQQYSNVFAIIDCLLQSYATLSARAIVGHSDIAPGRKTDPGPAFDWPRLRARLSGHPG